MARGRWPTFVTLRAGWSAARMFSLPVGARCRRRTRDWAAAQEKSGCSTRVEVRRASRRSEKNCELEKWLMRFLLSLLEDHPFHLGQDGHGFGTAQAADDDGGGGVSIVQAFEQRAVTQHGVEESGSEAVAGADGRDDID